MIFRIKLKLFKSEKIFLEFRLTYFEKKVISATDWKETFFGGWLNLRKKNTEAARGVL